MPETVINITRKSETNKAIQSSDLRQKMTKPTADHTNTRVTKKAKIYAAYSPTERPRS